MSLLPCGLVRFARRKSRNNIDVIFSQDEGAIWRSTPDALTTNKRGLPAYHYALGASSILNFDLGAPPSGHLYESPKNFPSLPAAINKV